MSLKTLDLFSGVGGFSLGLERTNGFRTVAFCEIDPFCQRVLKKHWPDVPIYDDVRTLTADALRRDGIAVDVICGGFPCQDISFAGRRAGLEGARSGLWSEYARLIGELRPRFVIVENVPGLLSLGMATVLGDLSTLGFDAVWDCIPACAVGAPHRRDRVWIVAHAINAREGRARLNQALCERPKAPNWIGRGSEDVPDAISPRLEERQGITGDDGEEQSPAQRGRGDVADAARPGWGEGRSVIHRVHGASGGGGASEFGRSGDDIAGWWSAQSDVGGMAHGISAELDGVVGHWAFEPMDTPRVATGVKQRVDRLRALGNSVVPQVATVIGEAILNAGWNN